MPARSSLPSGALPRPRKRLGQNFLRDRAFLARIIEAGELSPRDEVLEVGPGTGALTEALAAAAARVVAVELDDSLFALLIRHFGGTPNVEVIHGDALRVNPCDVFAGSYKLIANIPYYITGPLLRHFLEARCQPDVLVLMLQREVAQRIAASPGDLSLLGVSVQRYADPHIICRVPAGAFYPRPKVDSAIVRLTPHRNRIWLSAADDFFAVARAGFGLRRKQLVNALAHGLAVSREAASLLLADAGVAPSRRAETLSLEEWDRLASAWAGRKART